MTKNQIAKILYEAIYIDKWEESEDDFHKNDCLKQAQAILQYLKQGNNSIIINPIKKINLDGNKGMIRG